MIVLDASAVLEVLLFRRLAHDVMDQMIEQAPVALPDAVDTAVLEILGHYRASSLLSTERGAQAVTDLESLPATRFPTAPLAPRMWQLPPSLHASAAACLALAESLSAPLVTCDPALVAAEGHTARIVALI